MKALRWLPLTLIPVIAYNIMVFAFGGPDANAWITATRFTIPLPLGGLWQVSAGDILLILTLFILFFELLKSTSTSSVAMFDHIIATGVFIFCLVEFLVAYRAGTSVFFFITIAALIDVIAGFTIGMRVASRTLGVGV